MASYPRNRKYVDWGYYQAPGFPIQAARIALGDKNGFIQKPITSSPNQFWSHCTSSPGNRAYNAADVSLASTQLIYQNNPALWDQAYARAFARFKGQVRGAADAALGTFLAELPKAYEMVYQRLTQLSRAFKQFSRGNLAGAARILGAPRPSRNRKKSVADQWLEYSYGWRPAVMDLYNALRTLQNVPGVAVRARAGARRVYDTFHSGASSRVSIRVSVEMRAKVRVESPYSYTLETLGLVNPASTLWDLLSWSFLVDWFASVGTYLSNFSAFTGLELRDASYTYFGVAYDSTSDTSPWLSPPRMSKSWLMQRQVGIPPIPPITVGWAQISSMRAANAAALFVQQLSRA